MALGPGSGPLDSHGVSPLEAAAMLPAMDHLSSPATCPPNAQVGV